MLGFIVPYRNYANVRAGLNYKWQFTKTPSSRTTSTTSLDLSDTQELVHHDKAAITASLTQRLRYAGVLDAALPQPSPCRVQDNTDTATAFGLVAKF